MPGTTPRGFPFPLPTDPPDGAPQIEALARAIDSDNGRIDTLTRTINATVSLQGTRGTALPAATHTAIDLTTTTLAPPAGSGLLVVAQGGGLAVDVSVPCRLRLDGLVQPVHAGDNWRIPLAAMVVAAVPGQRWGIGALVGMGPPQRFQCSFFRNGAVEASRADTILPGVWAGWAANWAHSSVTASLTVTRLDWEGSS